MYLDCYILENFFLSYIILDCTSYISKIYTKKYRKLIGASLGTIYSLFYLYDRNNLAFTILCKFIFLLAVLFISFDISNARQFLKALIYFYLVNVFLSGSTYFVIYFTAVKHTSISILIICAYISCKILKAIVNDIKSINHLDDIKKEVKIVLLDEVINCTALLDSGNLLKEPISKDDVVIIKSNLIDKFLESDIEIDKIDISNIQSIIDDLNPKISSRIRIIPYKYVGSVAPDFLIGIKADYLEVDDRKIPNIILGISDFDEKSYNAILNPRILY